MLRVIHLVNQKVKVIYVAWRPSEGSRHRVAVCCTSEVNSLTFDDMAACGFSGQDVTLIGVYVDHGGDSDLGMI